MAPGPPNKGPLPRIRSHAVFRFELRAARPSAAKPDSLLLLVRVASWLLLWGGRGLAVRQKVTGAPNPLKKANWKKQPRGFWLEKKKTI
jgi:hypothetical protein